MNRAPGEAGERWFRRALLGAFLLALCTLAAVAVYLLRLPVPPKNIYFELQRQASVTYLGFWICIALLGAGFALFRRTQFLALYVLLLFLAEGGAHVWFHARNGYVYHPMSDLLLARFDRHPLLVGIPHPGVYGMVSHDADNRRTTVNQGKVGNPTYVFAVGGSTTYDVGVGDGETWTSNLSKLLGQEFAVENLGVPGYTSLENMIQSLFAFRQTRPACAIYYVGWNDLRLSHIKGPRDDYSDFALPSQIGTLAVGRRPGFLEANMLILRMAFTMFDERVSYDFTNRRSGPSAEKDEQLSRIFRANMKLIAVIARSFEVKAIFVPQVLNYPEIGSMQSTWTPLVDAKDVEHLMQAMNGDLADVARETNTLYLDKPLAIGWQRGDFVDSGHFSAEGAVKFAQAIAPAIAANCRRD